MHGANPQEFPSNAGKFLLKRNVAPSLLLVVSFSFLRNPATNAFFGRPG